MSGYKPKKGDHVEVTLRGEVLHVYGTGGITIADHQKATRESVVVVGERHVVSVEKVEPPKPPLPTTPGSVVRGRSGALFARRAGVEGGWVGLKSGATFVDLDGHFEVIFDAGAES